MKNLLALGGLVLGFAAFAGAAEPDPTMKGSALTLTGCVVASDSDSFVLSHVQKVAPDGAPIPNGQVLGAHGMECGPEEVIYWLSKDSVKKMQGLAGHQVEVTGVVTDVSVGTVKVRQEPGKDGRDNKVDGTAGGAGTARTRRHEGQGEEDPAGLPHPGRYGSGYHRELPVASERVSG
jgi:hypothetical protein